MPLIDYNDISIQFPDEGGHSFAFDSAGQLSLTFKGFSGSILLQVPPPSAAECHLPPPIAHGCSLCAEAGGNRRPSSRYFQAGRAVDTVNE